MASRVIATGRVDVEADGVDFVVGRSSGVVDAPRRLGMNLRQNLQDYLAMLCFSFRVSVAW